MLQHVKPNFDSEGFIEHIAITPEKTKMGGSVHISFELVNQASQ